MRQKGIPAAAVLAGGITRHGPYCLCTYCAPPVIPMAYARPIVEVAMDDIADAGVLQPPVPINPPVPREDDVFSQAFAATRASIIENVGGDWSPAQFVRAAS